MQPMDDDEMQMAVAMADWLYEGDDVPTPAGSVRLHQALTLSGRPPRNQLRAVLRPTAPRPEREEYEVTITVRRVRQ